ncbi:hypothetical protein JCM10207_005423 [Rhodosporidiobolus poonsookiae]
MSASIEKGALASPERSPAESAHEVDHVDFTPEEERKVVRKVDWALLPGLTFLYLLSFLDRSNIGNAKLFNMLDDIGLASYPASYNTSLALYFLGYVLFEIPANIVLKRFNPKIWLPTLTIAWGVTATLQGLIRNEPGFYAARFFMGVAEAGLFPGCIYVFSMFYRRNERHWRVAVFFGGAALAGSAGGILAWGIGHIHGGGLPNWAWIFVLEGIFTVLVGVTAYWWVPSYPREAKFLTERERAILLARLRADGDSADDEPFSWHGVVQALKDPLVMAYGWLFHGFAFPLYSLSLFLPTIIAQLGYASWKAQLLTIPVYSCAFFGIIFFAWASHRINQRGSLIILNGAIAVVGYVVLMTTHTAGARYTGAFIAVLGIYCANGQRLFLSPLASSLVLTALLLSWPSENVSPQTKRATASANQIFVGDIGAIVGVLVYRPNLNANFFRLPHGIAILYTAFGMLVAAVLWLVMRRANQTGNSSRAKNSDERGDRAPGYKFQL